MKSHSQDVKALLFLITLVGILAVPTYRSFLPPQNEPLKQPAVAAASTLSSRSPSSINKGDKNSEKSQAIHKTPSSDESDNRSIVLTYDCRKNDEIVVDARLLRLKAKKLNCTEEVSATNDSWIIKNHSNGFTGTLIHHQNGFTTDYIELKEGSNQIQLTMEDIHGNKIEKIIKVLRRSVASVSTE